MKVPGNIFLVGLMGVGKSTIGRHLAELLQRRFLDLDHEIEHRTGASIPLIFEIEGEAGFRKREALLLDELTALSDIVLATGGGAVLLPENRAHLRSRGHVVYLQADIETLVERTRRDRHRPLLQAVDPRAKLEELLHARQPLYEEIANLVIRTSHRSPAQVARHIATQLSKTQNENTSG